MEETESPSPGDDFIVWPDGTWCFRFELAEHTHKSDDFVVHKYDSPDWHAFSKDAEGL